MTEPRQPVTNGDILGFEQALWRAACPLCGSQLDWKAEFDADGTVYHAECCDLLYGMHPHTVQISVNPKDDDEEETTDE